MPAQPAPRSRTPRRCRSLKLLVICLSKFGCGYWRIFIEALLVAQMYDQDIEFRLGQRIRLSDLGKERCKFKTDTGVVVGRNNVGESVRVLMDGRKQPQTLHKSYVEMAG
jgi:hypothetical protein